jgi:hypothetical protein
LQLVGELALRRAARNEDRIFDFWERERHMLVQTAITNEFPLLAAIAHELGEGDDGNEVVRLLETRQLLKEVFHSLNHVREMEDAAA